MSCDGAHTIGLSVAGNDSPLPFGTQVRVDRGSPVLIVDIDPQTRGMLREYVLCLTHVGFVWIINPHITLKREMPCSSR
jgi:hypothetical protein